MNLEEYEREGYIAYARLAETIARILEVVVKGVPGIRVQQIQHRAKAADSLKSKLKDRGALESNQIEAEIKDLAGCRIIFYTNTDVVCFISARTIGNNFDVDWDRTKFHYPTTNPTPADLFISYNYVVKLKDDRTVLPEYAAFRGMWCEVQVQTTLDHAWSEMAHDTIYKRPPSGFGAAVVKDVEARMTRIMQKYLRPAGFDFQKVADEVQRLRRGRRLFDNDPLKTISDCMNNNERYHALREFKEYVLPYYDDLGHVAPAIRACVMSAAQRARTTPVTPTQYGFEEYTREHILDLTLDVIDRLRFAHDGAIEVTFDALRELLTDAEGPMEKKRLMESVRRLSEHDLSAWRQVGPLVQETLVERVAHLAPEQKEASRSVVVEVLGEVLKCDVSGTSAAFDSVTIHQGSVVESATLRSVRQSALEVLKALFQTAKDDADRRAVTHAFNNAMRPPSSDCASTDLLEMLLQDSSAIVNFYCEVASQISFELRQTVEHDLLWLHRNRRELPESVQAVPAVAQARDALVSAILSFRDHVNAERSFVIYKTLVGFQSVFPPAWDGDAFDIEEEAAYRNQQIQDLVAEVSQGNSSYWLAVIRRCAQTKSNDGATFPPFRQFLEEFARAKPELTFQLIDDLDDDLSRFLPSMLKGLDASSKSAEVRPLVDRWLHERRYLPEIAIYCDAPAFDAGLLERTIAAAIEHEEVLATILAMEVAARRQDAASEALAETVFLPGLRYLASIHDARWVQAVWPFARKSVIFSALDGAGIDEVLASLVREAEIEYAAEAILALIAASWPTKVVGFFIDRLRFENTEGRPKGYDAVPFSLSDLRKPLAKIPAILVQRLRAWYNEDERLFEYKGARLLTGVFPDFEGVESSLRPLVGIGERRDVEFVLAVLRAFKGQHALHPTCRDIAAALPPDDPLLDEVAIVLDSTGVVSGQFGFVEAYQRKKEEMQTWLADGREAVRVFGDRHIKSLDRQSAAEQRRATEDLELRKRLYDDPASGADPNHH